MDLVTSIIDLGSSDSSSSSSSLRGGRNRETERDFLASNLNSYTQSVFRPAASSNDNTMELAAAAELGNILDRETSDQTAVSASPPSCRRLSIKCLGLLLVFIVLVINMTYNFLKEMMDNQQLWKNIELMRAQIVFNNSSNNSMENFD